MSWSYSKLGTYERCPRMKAFKYDEKVVVTIPKGEAAARGTGMHDELERHLDAADQPEWIRPHMQYLERYKTGLKECKVTLDANWQPVVEDERDLICIIDLLFLSPPAATVIDYKSGKRYDGHVEQLELYCLSVLHAHPDIEYAEGLAYYLDEKPGGWSKPVVLTREHMPVVQARWEERRLMMDVDTECAPRPGWYCRFCDYRKSEGGPCRFG